MGDLKRFKGAQDRYYDTALAEIKTGHSVSHWMWYIFPQLASLGTTNFSQRYIIRDIAEAIDFFRIRNLAYVLPIFVKPC